MKVGAGEGLNAARFVRRRLAGVSLTPPLLRRRPNRREWCPNEPIASYLRCVAHWCDINEHGMPFRSPAYRSPFQCLRRCRAVPHAGGAGVLLLHYRKFDESRTSTRPADRSALPLIHLPNPPPAPTTQKGLVRFWGRWSASITPESPGARTIQPSRISSADHTRSSFRRVPLSPQPGPY